MIAQHDQLARLGNGGLAGLQIGRDVEARIVISKPCGGRNAREHVVDLGAVEAGEADVQ